MGQFLTENGIMAKPSRRTLIVLTILLGAMSVASVVLLVLHAAPGTTMGLAALERSSSSGPALIFETDPLPQRSRWKGISIWMSHSGQASTSSLHAGHKLLGLGGLASHFVIGNGKGMPDGQIAVSRRWQSQLSGYRIESGHNPLLESDMVEICLVGAPERSPTRAQMIELVRLVRQLQKRLDIGPDQVVLHVPEYVSSGVWDSTRSWLGRRLYQVSMSNLR
jgi:hypothetical protein